MQRINVEINGAIIESYTVTLNDDKPEVRASIGLYSGKKKISEFSLHTESYYSNTVKFDLPPDMVPPIVDIAKQLEVILTRQCAVAMAQLEEGEC